MKYHKYVEATFEYFERLADYVRHLEELKQKGELVQDGVLLLESNAKYIIAKHETLLELIKDYVKGGEVLSNHYDEYLKEIKEFKFSDEQYEHIEEIVAIAKRAKLRLRKPSEYHFKDSIEVMISLTGATAMLEAYKNIGEDAYIVYMNKNKQIVHHYVDGRIEVVKEDNE
ncbi:hypothetical protein [Neobacillus cucumis]|uniref:hypothetical protein n=1 Tax=Neobacillus cucumis TaxID=1740721 RepID=UPI001963F362|nr:hypothetical protein [Neobacillus cucumis]MBM7656211.1 hypothetical protein [Neobacillus cucumis]